MGNKTYITETTILFVVGTFVMFIMTWWGAGSTDEKVSVLTQMAGLATPIFLGGAARKVGEKFAGSAGPRIDYTGDNE